jgi:hypothetical protein
MSTTAAEFVNATDAPSERQAVENLDSGAEEITSTDARVLIGSNFNSWPRTYGNLLYEFCKVASLCDRVDVVAPKALGPPKGSGEFGSILFRGRLEVRRVVSKMRQMAGLRRLQFIEPYKIERDYDLFVFVCMFPKDLTEVERFQGWRDRSGKKVAVILETWSNLLKEDAAHLRMLDQFDRVFIYQQASIPNVQRYTRTPCLPLRGGVDALLAAPLPDLPPRVIDVYSMGRRAPAIHAQLVDLAERQQLFYLYDTTSMGLVTDWHESRLMTFNLIKRAKYFTAFDPMIGSNIKAAESAGEPALPMRYFEGAAGGSVILGTKPRAKEFGEEFDWPDVVIEVDPFTPDIRRVLDDLEAEPDRTARIRLNNVTNALRRFDWSYRWADILDSLGLEPTPDMHRRRRALLARAEALEAAASLPA